MNWYLCLVYWELPIFALAGLLATPLFWDEFIPFTCLDHILIASRQRAGSWLLLDNTGVVHKVLHPAGPTESRLWDGTEPGKLRDPNTETCCVTISQQVFHEHSASRLISCDVSLKQPSLGKLACTQKHWDWRGSFPPHLQTGARTEQREKPPSIGIHAATPLAARENREGKVRGRSLRTSKRNQKAQQSHDYLKTPQTVTAPIEPAEEVAFSCARTSFPARQPSGNEALAFFPAPLCDRVPTLAGQGTGSCSTYSPCTGRNMEITWKLALGGFNPI